MEPKSNLEGALFKAQSLGSEVSPEAFSHPLTGKPSPRNKPVSPGVIEREEGLRRLLPEPTPSPRLWAASSGATPAKLCEHTIWVSDEPAN
jgi:hypothetical protein